MVNDSPSCDVDGVIITGELDRRPSRAPDYQAENQALTALAEAMSTNPGSVLQRLVELAMELTRSDSAGISLLEPGGENGTFRWVATAGAWSPYRDGTMPREASPCGEVIAREAVLLMKNPERLFPVLLQAEPGIHEGLLAPFHVDGVPVGTVWTIKHSPDDRFDAEDARLIQSLARFASAAHQTVQARRAAEDAGRHAEIRVQQLVALADVSSEFVGTCDMALMPIYGNAAAMRMVGLADLEQVKRTPLAEFFFPEDLAFITEEFLPRVLREGHAKAEIRFRHFVTGEPVWVDYNLVVLKDETGRATGLGTVTHDLTERRRTEAALRESEERQAFLLDLSDALRPLTDPFAIQAVAVRVLGEHLGAVRAQYWEAEPDREYVRSEGGYAKDGPRVSGRVRLNDFGVHVIEAFAAGLTVATDDVTTDPLASAEVVAAYDAVGVRAYVTVPLVKGGHIVALLGVHHTAARSWTSREIALVEETAERTWAAVERARAEQVTRESEERFRTVTEAIEDVFYMTDLDRGELLYLSPSFERIWGIPPTTLLRDLAGFADTIHPEDRAIVADALTLQRDEQPVAAEYRIVRPDGTIRWIYDRCFLVAGDGSMRSAGIASDITARKDAEAALRDSEARFRALATVGSSSVYRMSPDWHEMRHLDGAAFLADTHEATPDWIDTYIPPDERPRLREAIQQAIAAKHVFELEHRILRADGTVGWTFSRAIPLLDDAGEITEWFGAATDVTARVQADRSFTRLFRASPAPFLVLKPDAPHFTITDVNEAYLSATMRTRDEVVGRGIFEAYPDNPSAESTGGIDALRASLERVLASRRPDILPNLQYDVARPDGTFETRWWRPVNSAVLGENGDVEALIHNANDVTEAHQAELLLRESEGRHTFLLELADTLRPLRDPAEVQTATMRLVAEHLDVMRASYFTIDQDQDGFSLTASYDRAAPPIPNNMRMSDFAPDMAERYRRGLTFVLEDAETEAPTVLEREAYRAIGIRAAVAVPLVKDGLLLGVFGVHSATPRHWSDAEIHLLEDVADRIWTAVDRAHAEAASREIEQRQAFLLKLSDALRTVADAVDIQATTARLLGEHLGADRCGYVEMDDTATFLTCHRDYHAGDIASFAGTYRIDAFGRAITAPLFAGATVVLDDASAHAALSDLTVAKTYEQVDVLGSVAAPLVKAGRLAAIFFVHQRAARRWLPAEVALIEDVAERTWAAVERSRAETRLRDSEARFRQFSDASTDILWIRDAATMRMEFASPAFDTIYGIPGPDRGGDPSLRHWVRLIEPESRKTVLGNFRRVRGGERIEQEFRIRRASDGALRWIHNTDFPLRDAAGNVRWVAGLGADITDAKESADRQYVLVAELQHRTRNLLGVIRSMSDKTGRSSADLSDFRVRFRTRLDALARVQGLLSRLNDHDRVTFDELIDAELAALDGAAERVSVGGPKGIRLRSSMVQTLAMAIHELATNAVKYGALVQPDGHLAITWELDQTDPAQPRLNVDWRESGVTMPPPQASASGGQGRELIERALPYQLSAETTYELGPDGVHCTISVPAVSSNARPSDVGPA